MVKREVLGEELWEANSMEARRLWKEHSIDRWRICSHKEVDAHMMDGPEEIAEWIAKKKEKPGEYLT